MGQVGAKKGAPPSPSDLVLLRPSCFANRTADPRRQIALPGSEPVDGWELAVAALAMALLVCRRTGSLQVHQGGPKDAVTLSPGTGALGWPAASLEERLCLLVQAGGVGLAEVLAELIWQDRPPPATNWQALALAWLSVRTGAAGVRAPLAWEQPTEPLIQVLSSTWHREPALWDGLCREIEIAFRSLVGRV